MDYTNEIDEGRQRSEKEGTNAKCLKVLLNLYSITNDNVTLVDGHLDLFYTTYYHVVILCIVKELIGTGRTLDMWSMI